MANVAISGDTSGAITLTVPATAGTQTVTFPAATGTAMVSGNMPAFSVYNSNASQSVATGTWTKVVLNSKIWDTASCFDATTNYRFTPNVAGYYQINGQVNMGGGSASGRTILGAYKNGSFWQRGTSIPFASTNPNPVLSTMVYLNGSTDYVELYAYQDSGGSVNIQAGDSTATFFNGSLVRSA